MPGPVCAPARTNVQAMHRGPPGAERREEKPAGETRVGSVATRPAVLVALRWHGAHILSGDVLSSLVCLALFILQAHLQLSNNHRGRRSRPANLPVCSVSQSRHTQSRSLTCQTDFIAPTRNPLLNLHLFSFDSSSSSV